MNSTNKYNFEINFSNMISGRNVSLMPLFWLSEKIKKGFKEEINLANGLTLVINEYKPKKNITIDFKITNAPIEFAYCLSGRMSVEFHSEDGKIEFLEVSPGATAIFYLPNTYGILKIHSNELLKVISLHCSLEYFQEFIDESNKFLKEKFDFDEKISPFLELSKSHANIRNTANQILSCEYNSKLKNKYLNSKSDELIIYMLEQINSNYLEENYEIITKRDIEKAQEIEKILHNNLVEVPSLLELADIASMTHTKLSKVFKNIYGQTVFGYLRELRLNKAKQLLDDSKLNITEITYETGWSNPSHFSREFKEKFGLSPKSYTKLSKK